MRSARPGRSRVSRCTRKACTSCLTRPRGAARLPSSTAGTLKTEHAKLRKRPLKLNLPPVSADWGLVAPKPAPSGLSERPQTPIRRFQNPRNHAGLRLRASNNPFPVF